MAYKQESVTIHLLKHYTLTIGKPPQFLILQSALPCKAWRFNYSFYFKENVAAL